MFAKRNYNRQIAAIDLAFALKNERNDMVNDTRIMKNKRVCSHLLASKYSDFTYKVVTDYLKA